MTLAKPTSTHTTSLDLPTADTIDQHRIALESRLNNLATQATDSALNLWSEYQPVTNGKTQAVWQLLRSTQPVQLLLTAALAVLAIALVTLVTTFNGLIILFLKLATLVLAAVAVWQWIARGLHWADEQLPSVVEPQE
ncbi:hypothetical protein [Leptothoe spongobia]|uniref:Uncharacterized protein n=1 Tax=Leptothoe spongobia TAU-MAC 1115 TaxID=1967444 RepID=A0A947DIV7_9CYAN|nr:hypothetical protein [Leptothoe spongobia]MBT9317265.1 hypothetical protein [Leptothoe spongobia TAU-MAC 1115]